ncbi:MAG: hypothetical protein IH863_03730 [Chloroflexi bacterium]|nr:hypothetical protein [Chloroflexota bacterium]
MPRRKRSRRQRLDRQEQRQEAVAAGVPVNEEAAPAPEPAASGSGVSFSGAAGGLLAAGMFFALATELLIDPGDVSRLAAIAWAFIGLCFLPAIWVSVVRSHPRRRRVLRITTIGVMVLAMLSLLLAGFSLAVLLAPPTALLAIGAGFIFQRSRSSA